MTVPTYQHSLLPFPGSKTFALVSADIQSNPVRTDLSSLNTRDKFDSVHTQGFGLVQVIFLPFLMRKFLCP